MKENWTYKKLGEVASYINGFAFKPSDWVNKGLPIIRIQNLNNVEADFNYYDKPIPAKYIVDDGDILISWSASLGVYEWTRGMALLNQHIFKVVFDKSDMDKHYLKYSVSAKLEAMAKLVHGATMQHIVKGDFDNTQIPVPPLSEQHSIVQELDAINEVLSKKREQLKELDKLAQSIFYDMFGDPVTNEKGWEVKKLGEVCSSELGKTLNQSKDKGNLHPYLCAINIHWGQIDISALKQAKFEDSEIWRYSVVEGDLLVCEGGDTGRAAIWRGEPTLYQNALHRLRFNDRILPIFCLYFLWQLKLKGEIDGKYSKGVTIKHLVKSSLLSIPIPLPPLPLQQAFAEKIEKIEQMKENLKASIHETETLLASRMSYWFE